VRAQLLFAHLDQDGSTKLRSRWAYERRWWGGRREYSYAAKRELWVVEDAPAAGHEDLVQRAIMRIDTAALRRQLPPHRRVMLDGFATRQMPVPQELEEWSAAGGGGKIPALEDLADMRQDGTASRLPAVCEWVANWHASSAAGRLLLVWAVYQHSAVSIADALRTRLSSARNPVRVEHLHGGLTPATRQHTLDAARSGNVRVMAATHASTGTGVDGLQHVAAQALMLEAPWTPGEARQTEGRLFRSGQAVPVTSYWVSEGIESAILRGIGVKAQTLNTVLSGADAVDVNGTPAEAPATAAPLSAYDAAWTWSQAPGRAPGHTHLVCWGTSGSLEWAGTAFVLNDPYQPARRVPVVLVSRVRRSDPTEAVQYGVWAWRLNTAIGRA
jgi:hypothetical protein